MDWVQLPVNQFEKKMAFIYIKNNEVAKKFYQSNAG